MRITPRPATAVALVAEEVGLKGEAATKGAAGFAGALAVSQGMVCGGGLLASS